MTHDIYINHYVSKSLIPYSQTTTRVKVECWSKQGFPKTNIALQFYKETKTCKTRISLMQEIAKALKHFPAVYGNGAYDHNHQAQNKDVVQQLLKTMAPLQTACHLWMVLPLSPIRAG